MTPKKGDQIVSLLTIPGRVRNGWVYEVIRYDMDDNVIYFLNNQDEIDCLGTQAFDYEDWFIKYVN